MSKVLVATSCRAENARYINFYRMRDELRVPEGSVKELYPGFFPEFNINDAVKKAIREDFTHLFILDDDVMLPPDTVDRLLKYDVDIVSANLLGRTPPFGPYLFDNFPGDEEGLVSQRALGEGDPGSLRECYAVGTGCTLIKIEVFKGLKFPWFEVSHKILTYDLYFCHKAKLAGFRVFFANKVPAGHLTISAVWPAYEEGQFKTTIVVNDLIRLDVPRAVEEVPGKLVLPGAVR